MPYSKKELQNLVAQDRTKEVIKILLGQIEDYLSENAEDEFVDKINKALLINSAKLTGLTNDENLGILSFEQAKISKAEVNKAILYSVDQLAQNTTIIISDNKNFKITNQKESSKRNQRLITDAEKKENQKTINKYDNITGQKAQLKEENERLQRILKEKEEQEKLEKENEKLLNILKAKEKQIKLEKSGNIIWTDDKNGYFIDQRDGHQYKVIKIGSQVWMAENLAFDAENGCWAYDNNENNVIPYGYLYDWETAIKVCPAGWHLPSDEEWKELEKFLGMSSSEADNGLWRETVGNHLKSTDGWFDNGNGTNSSGFNALPGGSRDRGDSFDDLGKCAYFLSSSVFNIKTAWGRGLHFDNDGVFRFGWNRTVGFSVRCLLDSVI